MKYLVVGEFQTTTRQEVGWVAYAADQLARGGFPVPYALIFSRQVMEEFLVETGVVAQFFSLIKKGKRDKAAALITNTKPPARMEEEWMALLDSHDIKIFDLHASPTEGDQRYRCLGLRRTHLSHALRACWAAGVLADDPFSAALLTKATGAKKAGRLISQHPLNNSRAHCLIELARPRKEIFTVNVQSGSVKEQEFRSLQSPLLIEEKDKLLSLAHLAQGFSAKPLVIEWLLGEHAYVVTYRELSREDRAYFLSQATSSGSS